MRRSRYIITDKLALIFSTKQQFVNGARKCAAFIDHETLFKSIEIETIYSASGLLAAKRLIADATSQEEKYIF
jgi:hypothetical protein